MSYQFIFSSLPLFYVLNDGLVREKELKRDVALRRERKEENEMDHTLLPGKVLDPH